MTYKVKLSPKVQKQLKKLDKHPAELIIRYLYKNIDGSDNPRSKGKGLTANRSGQWRYRVGDYRIICDIIDDELVVLAVTVGHRREIY
ncbi:type II toxin-antitoxin system RelE family toxin [Streptococcus saliviloxodontae]|uniref:mRNA interferase RelE/StbE n=1 Tax=Streptococcus saliviloxodontae TaxID=1349416 RepID=A0ABS2PJG5_9STRE|nr:type II toxin-antitoxin system RelE/ParE family toxin [Streptococcus saliviloxodontae]MBM7635573.1 mRNA interferase RelE/StbE [Streptococcus saliviloxodontae]